MGGVLPAWDVLVRVFRQVDGKDVRGGRGYGNRPSPARECAVRVKVVTLQYAASLGGFDERPLADFVRDKQVLAVREHFFTVHDLPHLACLITYQEPVVASVADGEHAESPCAGNRAPRRKGSDASDLLADLAPPERVLFGTLREWRSARARKEGVPPYVLFTNRELVRIVKARPATPSALEALEALDGIGAGKVQRYGKRVLALVNGSAAAAPAPEAAQEATA